MPAQAKIKASTQEHLNILDIQDDLLLLKDGSYALVLKTTAINFGLLSEKEQEATIFAYAAFLNSLTFSIQILIHSRQKDISAYLTLIDDQLEKQQSEKVRIQIKKYRQFIQATVTKNKVLDKDFYVVIPYAAAQLRKGTKAGLEKAKTSLYPKRDHVIGQFQRLGLKTAQLTNQELIGLLYSIYNPEAAGQKFGPPQAYGTTMVQASSQPKPLISQPSAMPKPKAAPEKPPSPRRNINALTPKIDNKPVEKFEGQKLQNQINSIVKKAGKKK